MKKKYRCFSGRGDNFRNSFTKCIKSCYSKEEYKRVGAWIKSLNVDISRLSYSNWVSNSSNKSKPSLTSAEKFLKAMPNLKIKVTNKLTKEEMLFDSFRDVILLVRKEYKSRYGTFSEAFRTIELLNENFTSIVDMSSYLRIAYIINNNGFDSIAIFLETLGLEGEIIIDKGEL